MNVTIAHRLPGRIRLDIPDIRQQPILGFRLESAFSSLDGIDTIRCNSGTGRALVQFDPCLISAETIVSELDAWLSARTHSSSEPVESQVAATSAASAPDLLGTTHRAASEVTAAPTTSSSEFGADNPYRLPMLASAGLLGALSLKRLLIGRSALALAPGPFYVAAGLSLIAGYPALRRPVESTIENGGGKPDLWLGLAALGLAALRENLVALSAITLLNRALYKRHQVIGTMESTHLDPAVAGHSDRMYQVGQTVAPLAWMITKNPLSALGVMLAANPRPAMLAHKHAWAQAERTAHDTGLPLPKQGNLEALTAARTIVFADGAAMSVGGDEWKIHLLHEGHDEGKVVTSTASLLQKASGHPLRQAMLSAVEEHGGTLRTPFHVDHSEDLVRGTVHGHDTILASKAYFKQQGLDLTPALMEERRMRRDGYKPYLLVQDGELIALIGSKQELSSDWRDSVAKWEEQGYTIRCLQQDERVPCPLEMMTVHELTVTLERNQPVILIGDTDPALSSAHLVRIRTQDVSRLDQILAFCHDVAQNIRRDLGLVKVWNWLGMGLAMFAPFTAPLINLLTDTVGVFLVTKQNWLRELRNVVSHTGQRVAEGTRNLLTSTRTGDQTAFFAMDNAETLSQLDSRLSGLSSEEVAARYKKYGANVLQAPEPPNPLRMFFGQFKDFSTLILLGATALSVLMGERFNAVCMGGILVINAAVGTWQELRSTSVLQALKNEDNPRAKVIRGGTETSLFTHELVPGDIVLLEAGDIVPADLRVLEAWNLEVNEAMLTGESLPVSKTTAPLPADVAEAERHNLVYMGTLITRGRARGVVTATGCNTQIGALQSLLHQGEDAPTPLQQRVTEIGKRFVYGALIAGLVVAAAGLMRGIPPMELLVSSITLAASAIPEGLPLTITIALTAGVMRMAKKKAVVRKLASLESLGRVTVICSDKTGTLTRNEMTVKELSTVSRRIAVTGDGYAPLGGFLQQGSVEAAVTLDEDARQLLTIGLLCNNAALEQDGETYKGTGDPTEAALLTVAGKAGIAMGDWKRHREIPFDSDTGSMSVVCQESPAADNCMMLTKGSPESILKKCTHYLQDGQVREITADIRQEVEQENVRMAEQALRVLGFAYRPLRSSETPETVTEDGLIYVGLMGMIDPPKEDVAESIREARLLGIKPVMITGDHPITARAIGKQLGIYQPGDRIITGEELTRLSAEELAGLVSATSIFARVSPEHKLRIVEAFQSNGDIVAMTGDGVNDAPAIRKADVGIAMGVQGTDITKDTAGIVLMEDHFHSIVEGIKEGRTIIGNIRKAIGCLLTGNLAEVLVTAAAVVVGLPMPLIPLQILLMNLLTDAVPAMVLATDSTGTGNEQRHSDVVDGPLYRTVITRGVILGIGALGVFAGAIAGGVTLPVAQTMTFATLVAGQLIQTVSWRRYGSKHRVSVFQDRSLLVAMGVSWLALASTIYLPALQGIFATTSLNLMHWATVLVVAGSVTSLASVVVRNRGEERPATTDAPIMQPLAA